MSIIREIREERDWLAVELECEAARRRRAQAALETARDAKAVALAMAADVGRERDAAREAARRALQIAEENTAQAEALARSLAYAEAALRLAGVLRDGTVVLLHVGDV